MRYRDKYEWSLPQKVEAPEFVMQIARVKCHSCGSIMNVPVRPDFVNWEVIAEDYRRQNAALIAWQERMIATLDVMCPDGNPVMAFIRNEWAGLALSLRAEMERCSEEGGGK